MINLNGIEKSALLLMSMSSDKISQVLKHLIPSEIELLTRTMLTITEKESKYMDVVLDEFKNFSKTDNFLNLKYSQECVLSILKKELGNICSHTFFDSEIAIQNRKRKLNILNSFSAEELVRLIEKEHVQIITIFLLHIDRNLSSKILLLLEKNIQVEVILRISKFKKLNRKVMVEFLNFIDNLLNSQKNLFQKINGLKISSEILLLTNQENKNIILNNMKIKNKELVNKLNHEMFVFENILDLDDFSIKILIKEISQKKLFTLLQCCNKLVQEKFLKNMSQVDSNQFYKNYSKKISISNSLIEEEKKEMVILIRKFLNSGKISLNTLG